MTGSGGGVFLLSLVVIASVTAIPFDEEDLQPIKSYSGYSLLRTEPIMREELAKSLLILDGMKGVHFWKYPLVNASSDILASPSQRKHIQDLLDTMGLSHNIMIEDVDDLLRQESADNAMVYDSQDAERAQVSNSFFTRYQRYDAIYQYAKSLAQQDSRVTYERIGTSSEGREIGVVKISTGGNNKPAVWIDGGMHAREWISPATATFIMNKLVKDPKSKDLVEMFDWYIVPIINVDGYEWTHTGDRMWRKTRSRNNGRCIGVDPNRNWGFHWAEQGSSRDPCSDIYHGPRAFSEPETAYVAKAIKARPNIKLYLTFHSYSQLWLVPYGYAQNKKPVDYNELVQLATIGKRALEATYRTPYRLGTAPDLLYPAAGGSDDWAKGAAGIKYSYCLELRDTGRYGFLLPASQIVPTGEETFNGVAAMAKGLHKKMKQKGSVSTGVKPILGVKPFSNANKELYSPAGGQVF